VVLGARPANRLGTEQALALVVLAVMAAPVRMEQKAGMVVPPVTAGTAVPPPAVPPTL
jgi:hypothetical protein